MNARMSALDSAKMILDAHGIADRDDVLTIAASGEGEPQVVTASRIVAASFDCPMADCGNRIDVRDADATMRNVCPSCRDSVAVKPVPVVVPLNPDGDPDTVERGVAPFGPGHVLRVIGTGYLPESGARFGVGCVGAAFKSRRVDNGPAVPGPYAYAFGLGTVIDNHGGTGAESASLAEQGLEHTVNLGDEIEVDCRRYTVELLRTGNFTDKHNIVLTPLEAPATPPGPMTLIDALSDVLAGADPIATADALVANQSTTKQDPNTFTTQEDTTMTTTTTTKPTETANHAECPDCGFKFPKPQPRCRNKTACERRQAAGKGEQGTHPAAAGTSKSAKAEQTARNKQFIDDRNARKAAASKGEGVKPGPERAADLKANLNGDDTPVRVKLSSKGQEALIDKILPGQEGRRSGRAGHWLLVFPGEQDVVIAALAAAVGNTDEPAKHGSDESIARTVVGHVRTTLEAALAAA